MAICAKNVFKFNWILITHFNFAVQQFLNPTFYNVLYIYIISSVLPFTCPVLPFEGHRGGHDL